MKSQAAEAVSGAAAAGTALAAGVGFAVSTDPFYILAAIIGGVLGGARTGLAAFDAANDRPVSYHAMKLAWSLLIGIASGFFLAAAIGDALNASHAQVVAMAFVIGIAGERVTSAATDTIVALIKSVGGRSQ